MKKNILSKNNKSPQKVSSLLLPVTLLGALFSSTNFDLQLIQPSIDSSYTFLYNNLLNGNFSNNSPVLTYGPLGFLVHTLGLGLLKIAAIVLHAFIGALSGLILFELTKPITNSYFKFTLIILGLLLINVQVYEWKIFAIFLLATVLAYIKNSRTLIYILISMSALFAYVKISLSIAAACVLLVAIILKKLKSKEWVNGTLIALISVLIFGLVFFKSLNKSFNYLINGEQLAAGFSSAMSAAPLNWKEVIIFLLSGIALILASLFFLVPVKFRSSLLVIITALFFVWKASITRQDPFGHVEALAYFVLIISYVGVVLFINKSPKKSKKQNFNWLGLLAIPGIILVFWGVYLNGLTIERIQKNFVKAVTFWEIETCQLEPCKSHNLIKIDRSLRTEIKDSTVDVYPWENLIVKVNDLKWRPRPSGASYSSYTPHLDNLDAMFLASRQAPDYLLWDIRENMLSIDGRHIFFDEPATIVSLLNHYDFKSKNDFIIAFHRKVNVQTAKKETTDSKATAWNKWINLPYKSDKIVLTNIKYEPNMSQKMGEVFFRPKPVDIEVKKQSGKTMVFRMVPKNATQGLMLNQLAFNNDELLTVLKKQELNDPAIYIRFPGDNTGNLKISYTYITRQ